MEISSLSQVAAEPQTEESRREFVVRISLLYCSHAITRLRPGTGKLGARTRITSTELTYVTTTGICRCTRFAKGLRELRIADFCRILHILPGVFESMAFPVSALSFLRYITKIQVSGHTHIRRNERITNSSMEPRGKLLSTGKT